MFKKYKYLNKVNIDDVVKTDMKKRRKNTSKNYTIENIFCSII